MRNFLLLYILAFLWVLHAKTNIAVTLYPGQKAYALSLAQQSPTSVWDAQVSFTAPDDCIIALPSRFKIEKGKTSLSLGYAGFWQGYALAPFLEKGQALSYHIGENSFVLLPGRANRWAFGYEHTMPKGTFSALTWIQKGQETTYFQHEWGAEQARWGIVGKALLESPYLMLHAESLFTPVGGMDVFVSSSCKYESCTLALAYGQSPYPSRYALTLALQSTSIIVSFVMEDWFGSKPIYGGTSSIRKRVQSGVLRFSLGTGYVQVSFSDTYEFKQRGSEGGASVMQATWKAPFGQVSAQYTQSRGTPNERGSQYKLSLTLHKASLSYTAEGYEIALTDTVAMGSGIGRWKLKKSMGKAASLVLSYAITSDR